MEREERGEETVRNFIAWLQKATLLTGKEMTMKHIHNNAEEK